MKCPNISHKDWKYLVSVEGEVGATAMYIRNGYEIPTRDELDSLKTKLTEEPVDRVESKDLQNLISIKTKAYSNMVNMWNIYSNKKGKGEALTSILNELNKSISSFVESDTKESLGIMFSNVRFTLNSLNKRLEGSELSMDALKLAKDLTNSFDILNDVSEYIAKTKTISDSDKSKSLHYISRLKTDIDKLNVIYNENIKSVLSKELSKISTIKRNERRKELEKEYKTNKPFNKTNIKRDIYNAQMQEWVNSKIKLESLNIIKSEEDYIYDLFETAPGDITNFAANIIDPKNITQDHIIQLMVKILEQKSFDIRNDFLKKRTSFVKKYESFINSRKDKFGPTDQIKLYGDILEKDVNGKPTQEYTKPMKQVYYDAWKRTVELASTLDTKTEKNKVFKEFYKKYTNNNPKDYVEDKELLKQYKDIYNEFGVKEEYLSDQYKNLKKDKELFEFYNYLMEFNKTADSLVLGSGKQLRYKLPSITAKLNENIKQQGIGEALKRYFKDNTKKQVDDYYYGGEDATKVLPTLGGKIYRTINIPFRGDIDLKDQSFDLGGMALSNMYAALNYHHKNSVSSLLELTKDVIAERDVINTNPTTLKKLVTVVKRKLNITEEEIEEIENVDTFKGDKSNSYKLLNSILEDRLYGISSIPGMFNIDKLASFAMKISANNFLIANYSGGVANILQGKVMNFLEGVGGAYYNKSDLSKGDKKYWKDINNNLNDIGKEQASSKTNTMLYLLLGDAIGIDGFANDLTQDSKFKRVFNSKNLHAINNVAENYIQGTAMYSYLNTFKVKNDKGEYVNIKGEVVEKDKAATIDEVLNFEDNIASIDSRFKIDGYEDVTNINVVLSNISVKFREIVKDMHGNYSNENKSMIQRHWYGKLVFFMRKFLVPGVQRRYKGLRHVATQKDNIPLHQQGYSEFLENSKEGTYTTLVRFMYELKSYSDKLSTELLTTNWNNLNDYERGNIRQAISELGIMVAALIASTLLAKLAEDDDDNEGIYAMSYFLRRLWGEEMFYTPIALISGESLRILESPTATISTMKRIGLTIDSLIEDAVNLEFRTYQSGKRKGQYKSLVNLNNLLNPFWKQTVDLSYKDKLGFLKSNY